MRVIESMTGYVFFQGRGPEAETSEHRDRRRRLGHLPAVRGHGGHHLASHSGTEQAGNR